MKTDFRNSAATPVRTARRFDMASLARGWRVAFTLIELLVVIAIMSILELKCAVQIVTVHTSMSIEAETAA